MTIFETTALEGVLVIKPSNAVDHRGRFVKLFHAPSFEAHGLVTQYAEHYVSTSARGVVRGLHFQTPPQAHAKIVSCLAGAALDVVVDLRSTSATYGRAASFDLSADVPMALYIPEGFAHGFAAMRDETLMTYMVSTPYSPAHDTGILWNSIDLVWPFSDAPMSARDRSFQSLRDFVTPF